MVAILEKAWTQMQIHQLRYFCAVARTGSFTRAAQHEHLAQPSLSQQVRKLEDELGTRLFDRLGRTVRLTQMGEAFLPRAEAILRQVGAAKLEIQEMAGTEQGKLVIGAIPTIAPYFLPSRLASFARKFPRVQVSVVEEITNELLNRIQEREGCRFVPLADDSAYRRVGIVQLKQHFRSRVHRAFLEHLRQGQEQRDVPLRFKRVAV